jgi:hypothetical protein
LAQVELPFLYNWKHALPFPIYSGIKTSIVVDERILNLAAQHYNFFAVLRREVLEKKKLCCVEDVEIPFLILRSIYFERPALNTFNAFDTTPLMITVGGEIVADVKWYRDGLPKRVGPHVVDFRDIYLPDDLHHFCHGIYLLHSEGKVSDYHVCTTITSELNVSLKGTKLSPPERISK